ncbi:MAG: hypothetical protein AAGK93_06665 [Pseudomonadota bacterium]
MVNRVYSNVLETLCANSAADLGTFTYFDLAARASTQTKTVGNIVQRWEKQGLVERLGKGPKNRMQFKVTEKGSTRLGAPLDKDAFSSVSPEKNMWTAMRMLKMFTPRDIAVQARTDAVDITLEQARAFCRMLVRGEQPYLKARRTAIPGRREATYQLIHDTGPIPPRECRVRAIYDANLAAFTHMPEPTS